MKLLTIAEAAQTCRMSEGYITQAIRSGELRVVQFGKVRGRRVRIEDLEAFIQAKIVGTVRSHESKLTELTKVAKSLNQQVTARDTSGR